MLLTKRQIYSMNKMKKLVPVGASILSFMGLARFAYAQGTGCNNNFCVFFFDTFNNASGTNATDILSIVQSIGGFLLVAGGIIAGIVIIAAGLMWMAAGSNPTRVTAARSIFKNGIIGALVIFAAGLIIQTIILLATDWQTFFQ